MKKGLIILVILICLGAIIGFNQNVTTATNIKDIVEVDTVLVALDQWGSEVGLAKRVIFDNGDELIDAPFSKGKLQECCSFRKDIWLFASLREKVVKPYLITPSTVVVKYQDHGTPHFYRIKKGS